MHDYLATHGRRGRASEGLIVSRLCEAFHLAPSAALKELRRAPDLCARVLEERDYAYWLERWKSAGSDADVPKDGENATFDLVIENETERLRESMRRRRET